MESKVTPFSSKITLNLRGKLYDLSSPLVMGILNVTPDSFYDGGRYSQEKPMANKLVQMAAEGVDIIDIGGYSSRPGAEDISVQEELDRVIPAIEQARKLVKDLPLSIDTFRSEVAAAALDAGVDMVNDISGGSLDPAILELVARRQVPYVLMHMRGNPQNMVKETVYQDLLTDIMQYFAEKLSLLREKGVADVIIDPGFGFAKTREQSFRLLGKLDFFKELEVPIMAGLSRKSMIYKTLGVSPDDALLGTAVVNTIALINGASILRVHDVKAAHQTIRLYKESYP